MSSETPVQNTGLPDGIGLDQSKMQELLIKQFKTPIGDNDPILMEVAIYNNFLEQYNKLLGFHHGLLMDFFSQESEKYLSVVQSASDAVKTGMSKASIEHIGKLLKDFNNSMMLMTIIIFISAIINVAVFVLRSLK
ncbi:MAG: hypothetical protein HQK81_09075 [Desulfovibrionaceae bacterium]|nr:hypothetical protein [Desulfovibrionaceae bacterium]MBF0514196.1 hypothetical protein [Desulfovibrionaceae bacterium]